MKHLSSPINLNDLKEKVSVLGSQDVIKTGYILDIKSNGDLELLRYENYEEIEYECFNIGVLVYDTFDEFMKQIKEYTGRKKLYISIDYALILLSILNGGLPEDYE